MLFIVTHHLIIKGAGTCGYMTPYDYNRDGWFGLLVNGLVVGGVNIFVLISGYFGIKHLLKPILKLAVDLTVYGVVAYLIGVTIFDINFSLKGMIHGIDIHNWFVVQFALLVLSAPILESVLREKDTKTIGQWVVLLLIINVFFGYILGYVNVNGYNYLNFILLYFMARYVRVMKENKSPLYIHIKKYGILYWLLPSLLLMAGMICLWHLGHVPSSIRYFGYNNPLILLSSLSVFILFSSLNIRSIHINKIATGMFGVFLLHTPPEIIPIRNAYSSLIFQDFGYMGIFIEAIALFSVLTIIAVPVENINSRLLNIVYGIIKK